MVASCQCQLPVAGGRESGQSQSEKVKKYKTGKESDMLKKLIMFGVIFLLTISGMTFGEEQKVRRAPRAVSETIDIEAKVEAVDYEKREVLLRGPMGNLVTVEAGDNVKRLNEIKVGDSVHAKFFTYLQAEFRDPTEEEVANPLVILEDTVKTVKDLPPGGATGSLIKAVVTIEIIDRPDMMVTVKGPQGNYVSIPVSDANLLEELKIGEIVILTYVDTVALVLEKTGS